MKLPRNGFRCFRCALQKIHLVDKCLMVFMAVLLIQSAISLVLSKSSTSETEHIDTIVRTSTAAIFGYFLSANFIRHASSGKSKKSAPTPPAAIAPPQENGPQNRIGFTQGEETSGAMQKGKAEALSCPAISATVAMGRIQTLVAAGIGLFCLLVLILLRDFDLLGAKWASSPALATVAQFRDFVSGCVGFLIGSPTTSAAGDDD